MEDAYPSAKRAPSSATDTHLFQKMLVEQLLYARHCLGIGDNGGNKTEVIVFRENAFW